MLTTLWQSVAERPASARHLGEMLQDDQVGAGWLLIDPFLRSPHTRLIEQRGTTITRVPVELPLVPEERRPLLIGLDARAVDLLETGLALALDEQSDPERESREGFAVGGWIFSKAPVHEVARHLARVMKQWRPGQSGMRYVRWADRRVLEWMWPALDDTDRCSVMGPIDCWLTVDRSGRWMDHRRPHVTDTTRPLNMARLWPHADQGEIVHTMVRGWRQFATDLPHDYLVRAASAVAAGQALGLTEQADLMLLGAYILQIHPKLASHAVVRGLVERAMNSGSALQDALATVPDPQGWDAIRAELDAGGHVPSIKT